MLLVSTRLSRVSAGCHAAPGCVSFIKNHKLSSEIVFTGRGNHESGAKCKREALNCQHVLYLVWVTSISIKKSVFSVVVGGAWLKSCTGMYDDHTDEMGW